MKGRIVPPFKNEQNLIKCKNRVVFSRKKFPLCRNIGIKSNAKSINNHKGLQSQTLGMLQIPKVCIHDMNVSQTEHDNKKYPTKQFQIGTNYYALRFLIV